MGEIPKIIHYCWFGSNEIPEHIKRNIERWREKLPSWEYKCWNEKNFDVENSIPYVQEAYRRKKYAFVSDYVRLCALRDYGGVYLDTDIDILKSFEPLLLGEQLVIGFEKSDSLFMAVIACQPHNKIISDFAKSYENRNFLLSEDKENLTSINSSFTMFMKKFGLRLNDQEQHLCNGTVHVYPSEYFTGYDLQNAHSKVTKNTCTFHDYGKQSSWNKIGLCAWIKYKIFVNGAQKLLGYDGYDRLKEKLGL